MRSSKASNRAHSTALIERKLRAAFSRADCSHFEEVELPMSKEKVPSQDAFRRSDTGRFTTERYAERHPKTTEHERIKHPERK
jgi:hypothetical protein